jgi:hypothetical protein
VQQAAAFDRFTVLLLALASLLLLAPLLDGLTDAVELTAILFLGLMLALVRAVSRAVAWTIASVALVSFGFVYETALNLHLLDVERPAILAISPIAYLVLIGIAMAMLLRALLDQRTVTRDTVRGGIALYLLMAIFWMLLFETVAILDPAAFTGPRLARDPAELRGAFLYFSLTTLTTLGYGDIVPVAEPARILATLEAVAGQIFLVVFMARLVGVQVAQESARR